MNKRIIAQDEEIVMGVDVHDETHRVCVVARSDGRILKENTLSASRKAWEKWLGRFSGCGITVVYEAGPCGYNLHDVVRALGCEAVVIAPVKHLGVKTDKRDARSIARDFLALRSSAVTVPDYDKRVRRQVLRTRHQLKEHVKRLMNQLNSLLKFHGMSGGLGSEERDESGYLEFVIEQMKDVIDHLRGRIKGLEAALEAIAGEEAYRGKVEALREMKGVGLLCALEVVVGVAETGAFESSGRFASYTGLCPGERSSGESVRRGNINRRGPGRLRGMLVQSAWSMVRSDEAQREKFEKLKARVGAKRAIVAMARKLAVRMWWKLNELGAQAA